MSLSLFRTLKRENNYDQMNWMQCFRFWLSIVIGFFFVPIWSVFGGLYIIFRSLSYVIEHIGLKYVDFARWVVLSIRGKKE